MMENVSMKQKCENKKRFRSLIHSVVCVCSGSKHWDSGAGSAELEVLAKHFKVQKATGATSQWLNDLSAYWALLAQSQLQNNNCSRTSRTPTSQTRERTKYTVNWKHIKNPHLKNTFSGICTLHVFMCDIKILAQHPSIIPWMLINQCYLEGWYLWVRTV